MFSFKPFPPTLANGRFNGDLGLVECNSTLWLQLCKSWHKQRQNFFPEINWEVLRKERGRWWWHAVKCTACESLPELRKRLHYFRVKKGETQRGTFLLWVGLNAVQMGLSALSPLAWCSDRHSTLFSPMHPCSLTAYNRQCLRACVTTLSTLFAKSSSVASFFEEESKRSEVSVCLTEIFQVLQLNCHSPPLINKRRCVIPWSGCHLCAIHSQYAYVR